MLPPASTASMVAAVSRFITISGGWARRSAATTAHSNSPPSWAGLSMRMRTPLFRPGPTVIRGAWVILPMASRTRGVSAGTTLARMALSSSSGDTPYSSSMLTSL